MPSGNTLLSPSHAELMHLIQAGRVQARNLNTVEQSPGNDAIRIGFDITLPPSGSTPPIQPIFWTYGYGPKDHHLLAHWIMSAMCHGHATVSWHDRGDWWKTGATGAVVLTARGEDLIHEYRPLLSDQMTHGPNSWRLNPTVKICAADVLPGNILHCVVDRRIQVRTILRTQGPGGLVIIVFATGDGDYWEAHESTNKVRVEADSLLPGQAI